MKKTLIILILACLLANLSICAFAMTEKEERDFRHKVRIIQEEQERYERERPQREFEANCEALGGLFSAIAECAIVESSNRSQQKQAHYATRQQRGYPKQSRVNVEETEAWKAIKKHENLEY